MNYVYSEQWLLNDEIHVIFLLYLLPAYLAYT